MSKKDIVFGSALTVSFIAVLTTMFMPIFDDRNFIHYADDTFNELSKGSVYFIPEVEAKLSEYNGEIVSITLDMGSEDVARKTAILYSKAGADVKIENTKIRVVGELSEILLATLEDADAAYRNDAEYFKKKYGHDARETLYYWWLSLSNLAKSYEREGKFNISLFIKSEIITKAVEPAYNFYGIKAKSISQEGAVALGMLVFYVVYTIWWGFAIYYIFEGMGLKIEKAKEKREV